MVLQPADSSKSNGGLQGHSVKSLPTESSFDYYLRKVAEFYWSLDTRYDIHRYVTKMMELTKTNPTAGLFFGVIFAVCLIPIIGFLLFVGCIFVGHIFFFGLSLIIFLGFGICSLFIGLISATVVGCALSTAVIAIWLISLRMGKFVTRARQSVTNRPASN